MKLTAISVLSVLSFTCSARAEELAIMAGYCFGYIQKDLPCGTNPLAAPDQGIWDAVCSEREDGVRRLKRYADSSKDEAVRLAIRAGIEDGVRYNEATKKAPIVCMTNGTEKRADCLIKQRLEKDLERITKRCNETFNALPY